MARRTAKRRSSRRRPLRQNPLSTKQKLGLVGGLVVVGGVAAYALTSGSTPPPVPTGPTVDPRLAKAAECAALQASLVQLRNQLTPDAAEILRADQQWQACLAQARELGATVDAATTHLANADASFAQIESWFNEYRAKQGSNILERNNARQSILNGGAALAATYANAIAQSTSPEQTKLIAQSIVRALDASISRRICFWNGTPGPGGGCGTEAAGEDQPDTKAGQERERVTAPLIAAYAQAVAKVGGPARALANADGERYLAAILRPSANLRTWIDGQFSHYKATDAGWDALKRNNTRGSILAAGREMVTGLRDVFNQASSFGSLPMMRQVGTLTITAINSSIDRWACFYTGQQGCHTIAGNEPQPDVKAAEEMAAITTPLMLLYAQIAGALALRGEMTAYEPLITAKLRVCQTIKNAIDAQFSHYKSTEWSDFAKRNNTRGWMLAAGASLATCLEDALSLALSGKAITAPVARGVAGLGAAGPFVMMATPLAIQVPMQSIVPSLSRAVTPPPQRVDVVKLVRPIAALTVSAIDAAVTRKLCYLYDQTGCGRFGDNEAHGVTKAQEEQTRVINPLIRVYKRTVPEDKDNAQAEAPLMRILLREVEAAKNFINAQYQSLKATSYLDGLKRTNIRGSMIEAGRRLVTTLRDAKPVTVAGKGVLRPIAQEALTASREREACYRSGAAGCDRLDDAGYGAAVTFSGGAYALGGREDDRNVKAKQEADEIGSPLAAILANKSAGLGSVEGEDAGLSRWLGVGAVALVAMGIFHASKKPRRNRSRRRTSRRAEA
jgi:uncharacterized protein YejL (UPF0352 family)